MRRTDGIDRQSDGRVVMEYLWSTPREVLRREITKVTVRYRKYVEGRNRK